MTAICIPELPFKLIQAIRLSHALMESEFTMCIPAEHAFKYQTLKELFGASFTVGTDGAIPIHQFEVTHPEPMTAIGSIKRPLIFPHAIVQHCKSLWQAQRETEVSFAGLVTGKRADLIGDWCRSNLADAGRGIPNLNPFFHRLINKLRKKLGLTPKSYSVQMNELLLWSSLRGRAFPIKSWDQEYYELMARSKYVLCPSGVHVWSYRFFESILCGAIPIIEADCPAYAGFKCYTMQDKMSTYQWNEEMILHNYNLCVERITIPADELNAELQRLIVTAGE